MTGNPKPGMGSANRVLDKIPDKKRGTGVVLCLNPESVKLIFSKARKTHSYCVYRMFLSKIAIHLSGECIAW
jgi:hypothetical protein